MIVQEYPDIELPMVIITTILPGASPDQLENEVARKLENAISNISNIKHIYSVIAKSSVTTIVELQLDKNLSDAMNDIRDTLNRVRSDLPTDITEQHIGKIDTAGRPILTYVVTSPNKDEAAISRWVDNKVFKVLQTVRGVGNVSRIGGVDREIRVEVDPIRMAALNASIADISRQIQRVQQEASGGIAELNGVKQTVRIIGTLETAADIANLEIPLSDGRRIKLNQVADVSDTYSERLSSALLDGESVVAFEVTRAKGASEIDVANKVRAALKTLHTDESHIDVVEAFNGVDAVTDAYSGSMQLLYEGALLAVFVVWLFLRDWRATFISTLALPLSVIPTFALIHYMGFSLNTVTLQSLALVVGILVDDAIVEIENIVRHLRMGKSPKQAAMDAADEIGLAVVATTLTLVAVFLPTIFMTGITGKFFTQFGWTSSIAILFSLLVARLLTPMMAAYLLKPVVTQKKDSRLMGYYQQAADWCLAHRKTTVFASMGIFIASLALVPLLPKGFLPIADRGQTMVSVELPPGESLANATLIAEQVRTLVQEDEDVVQIYTSIGEGFAGGNMFASSGPNQERKATLTVNLTQRSQRERTQSEIETDLRKRLEYLPGVRIVVGSGGMGEQLTLVLSGEDPRLLEQSTHRLLRELRTVPGVGNISSSVSLASPELVVIPDFSAAAELGVTTQAMGEALRIATSGDYSQVLAKLNLAESQVPIRVRLPDSAKQDISTLSRLSVPGKYGNVMLGAVAEFKLQSGPEQINRYDRNRIVNVTVELNGKSLGATLTEVNALPFFGSLPAGIKRVSTGDAEVMEELFASFGVAMITGVLCIYMLLVLLFKDFFQPITIIAALPLSIGGAFGALLITKNALSMPSLIGLLMLMGIAVKNSILLVEYTVVARKDKGLSRVNALRDACHKRARPIIMTSIAMGAGMFPVALGMGADPSFRVPMATVIIGGLITSTLLSLFIIPVIFTYIDDMAVWLKKPFEKKDSTHGLDFEKIINSGNSRNQSELSENL